MGGVVIDEMMVFGAGRVVLGGYWLIVIFDERLLGGF